MTVRRKYLKRADAFVIAVQLNLTTDGFSYEKWGDTQRCKAKDWIVDNDGEVYTIDRESFSRTYTKVGPGRYAKTAPVWAEVAVEDGEIDTKEGVTHYRAGDFLISNEPDGTDTYAVTKEVFEKQYTPAS